MIMNMDPKRVKCQRDGCAWTPRVYTKRVPNRVGDHIVHEDQLWIDCPTCKRGYQYDTEHDRWMSDRPLTILTP
jgi:hypothetical protein